MRWTDGKIWNRAKKVRDPGTVGIPPGISLMINGKTEKPTGGIQELRDTCGRVDEALRALFNPVASGPIAGGRT